MEKIKHFYGLFESDQDKQRKLYVPLLEKLELTTAKAIIEMSKNKKGKTRILDVCGGGTPWGKTIAYLNSTKTDVTCIESRYNRTDTLHSSFNNFEYVDSALNIEDKAFDVVRLQAFSSENIDNLIDAGIGLLLIEDKFFNQSNLIYAVNDKINEDNGYFNHEVLSPTREYCRECEILSTKFKYIHLYYRAGNFRGIACSNNKNTIIEFLSMVNLKDNQMLNARETIKVNSVPISTFTNSYNETVALSPFGLQKIKKPSDISNGFTDSRGIVFFAVSKDNEFCSLHKKGYAIYDNFINDSISIRESYLPSGSKATVNVFSHIKCVIDTYKNNGFKVFETQPFNKDFCFNKKLLDTKPDIVWMDKVVEHEEH